MQAYQMQLLDSRFHIPREIIKAFIFQVPYIYCLIHWFLYSLEIYDAIWK